MPQNGTVYDNSSSAFYYEGGGDDIEYGGVEAAANFGNESAASAAAAASPTEVGCYESLTDSERASFIKEALCYSVVLSGKLKPAFKFSEKFFVTAPH